jgi:hypothetical protein
MGWEGPSPYEVLNCILFLPAIRSMGGGRTCVGDRRAVTWSWIRIAAEKCRAYGAADRAGQVREAGTTVSNARAIPPNRGLHGYIRLSIFHA